jgi:hypothetical protein
VIAGVRGIVVAVAVVNAAYVVLIAWTNARYKLFSVVRP